MMRFIDVPVGAEFTTKNGMRFKKTYQPTPDEYYKRPDQMHENGVLLSNGHRVCLGVLVECWLVEDEH